MKPSEKTIYLERKIEMNSKRFFMSAVAAVALVGVGLSGAQAAKPEPRNYLLATASTGGTYFPVGVALSTLVKVKLQPKQKIGMSAINSAGSGENVKLLREQEAQFAIMQGLFGSYAWNGTGPVKNDGPQKHLRSVTLLWPNVEQYVILKEHVKTGTIDDLLALKGKSMALGKQNSGTIGSNTKLLSHFGINIKSDFKLVHAGYGPSADALQNGQVAGIGAPAGPPTGAVTKLMAAVGDKVQLLNFTPEQAKKADAGLNLWVPYTIKAGTYPGQKEDVQTVAQPNFLATHAAVPEEDVYKITKTIYENLPFLNAIHKATKAMSIEVALNGLPAPLHPGAAKYYKEVGINIPDHLIAK